MLSYKLTSVDDVLKIDRVDEEVACEGENRRLVNVCYMVVSRLARIARLKRFAIYDGAGDVVEIYPVVPDSFVNVRTSVRGGVKLINCTYGSDRRLKEVVLDVMEDNKNVILLSVNGDVTCNATVSYYANTPVVAGTSIVKNKVYGFLIPSLTRVVLVV